MENRLGRLLAKVDRVVTTIRVGEPRVIPHPDGGRTEIHQRDFTTYAVQDMLKVKIQEEGELVGEKDIVHTYDPNNSLLERRRMSQRPTNVTFVPQSGRYTIPEEQRVSFGSTGGRNDTSRPKKGSLQRDRANDGVGVTKEWVDTIPRISSSE